MGTPLSKKNPNWLARQCEYDPKLNKNYRRSVRYYKQVMLAWPEWVADDPRFKQIYKEAARRRKRGEIVAVDHIVPICSKSVCGLHVPWNLRIITKFENESKSNSWWPDCPWDTKDMWPDFQPHQMRLV